MRIIKEEAIITHAQITDVFLGSLAVRKRGERAALDQRIPVEAVRGGRRALELLIGCRKGDSPLDCTPRMTRTLTKEVAGRIIQ